MATAPSENEGRVLTYRREDRSGRGVAVIVLAVCSGLCVAVPVFGYVTRNGPLFLSSVLLSFAGIALGAAGVKVSGSKATLSAWDGVAGLCALFAATFNALAAAYFVWLFFVRGLC